jgi:hypothetical protein
MNINKFPLLVIILVLFGSCNNEAKKPELSDKIQIKYKDILDLRLQILAAQMTSGSFSIIDMGSINYPVSISINDQNKIIFKIVKTLEKNLSEEIQKEIIQEGFEFVNTGIAEMIRKNLPGLDFDFNSNIIGYWYYDEYREPQAIWENSYFKWATTSKEK